MQCRGVLAGYTICGLCPCQCKNALANAASALMSAALQYSLSHDNVSSSASQSLATFAEGSSVNAG